MKDSYEKLITCKGSDGPKLIELWGLALPNAPMSLMSSPGGYSGRGTEPVAASFGVVTESAVNSLMGSPDSQNTGFSAVRLARSKKKKPLGKISQNNSRSSSLMNET
jgi:hypothetical protein